MYIIDEFRSRANLNTCVRKNGHNNRGGLVQ